jgi:hypothetical protein
MFRGHRKDGVPLWAGNWSRLAATAVFGWTTLIDPVLGQSSQPPAAAGAPAPAAPEQPHQDPVYSLSDIEYLLGPIALFSDTLLALILPATTFPVQIDEADLWLAKNPEAVKRKDFTGVDAKEWDSSVKALVRFPDVIKMLADHLDWTESVGMAFALQPDDVALTIQTLRAKAERVGNLKSTPQQVVTKREEGGTQVIYISPANPERIYVPVYDSTSVFDTALPEALLFGSGVLVGAAWNNRWGWNDRRWNQVWLYRPVWHAPPPNWRPRPGRPGVRPPGAWRPDRPGVRPERPGVRPERPGVRPERPGVRPERPGTRPERPGARPERPGARPERPGARPERPGARPERPGARPERPGARPERPGARPERPGARPERPGARPERPAARPNRPAARPERPTARPNRPAARPNRQAARPGRQAAPPQQRARPQHNQGRGQQRARSQQRRGNS